MLFTQATEAGIALENGLLLTDEQYNKAVIPANCNRIKEWARDNHVNISISPEGKSDAGFNCVIGIMQDERVSDSTYQANKKMLKHLGDELIEFINNLPDKSEEAEKAAEIRKKLDELVDKFQKDVKDFCGEDTAIIIKIVKIPTPEELINTIAQIIKNNETANG